MSFKAFSEAERAGWADSDRAAAYVDLFAPVSDQLVPSLVAAVEARPGQYVLDLCCGHGNAAAALREAGATVAGADFSPAMVELARKRVPDADFVVSDAADLPFDNESFDAVVCNVGFGHLPNPAKVLSEVARVLRPNGVAAMTSWREPECSPTFQIVFSAVKAHGDPGVVPPAPDFHLFSRRDAATDALATAGLQRPEFSDIDAAFAFSDPATFADVFECATVRAAMMISSQDAKAKAAIRNAMTERVREDFGEGDGVWRVPFPATLVLARRS